MPLGEVVFFFNKILVIYKKKYIYKFSDIVDVVMIAQKLSNHSDVF